MLERNRHIAMANKKTDKKMEMNYEDILKTMTKEGGVRGWIVVNWEGIPVKYQVFGCIIIMAY